MTPTPEAEEGRNRSAVNGPLRGLLVVITGTGTAIGKTHAAEALILAWTRRGSVIGLKPVESGVRDQADAARLAAVSSFHVKQSSAYRLAAPLSPHLAARDEGIAIRIDSIVADVFCARKAVETTVVELAGGLFTPLADGVSNADLIVALAPDSVLLVAPDRLGVLHDVAATVRAAAAMSVRLDGVVLVAPDRRDASTGRNASELPTTASIPVWAEVPRGSPTELSELPQFQQLIDRILMCKQEANKQ